MAADMGTKRIPCTGERNGSDFETSRFCFQLKVRRMLPKWMWEWLGGIVGKAGEKGKIGILVLRVPRQQDDDALVVLRWRDWRTIVSNDQPDLSIAQCANKEQPSVP